MQFETTEHRGHLYVIPSDALTLVNSGVLDRRLFDVTTLLEYGYDDAAQDELPLIVQHNGDSSTLATATVTQSLPSIGGSGISTPKSGLAEFWDSVTADTPGVLSSGVRRIWLDGERKAVLDRSAKQIGAPTAWEQGVNGKGVTVAVLDTGVDQTHPDLADREITQRNFTDSKTNADHFGHGTHVAGTVAGTGEFSGGKYRGIAHGSHIIDGKVLNDSGSGKESWIIAGMQWAADQKADIANLSLGGGDTPAIDPLEEAVNTLSAKTDTLFVIAAGNSGPGEGTVGSPGSADAALTVGAVDRQDQLADFSSRGPRDGDGGIKPDITAPGVGIVAALHSDATIGEPIDGRYTALDGTSMATPHVAGAAALLAQAHPDYTGEQLKAVLTSSAEPNPSLTPFEQGSGRVDVPAALAQTISSAPTSLSFGTQRWPHHDDEPVSKPVTYRNTGDKPVTLDLSVQGSGDTPTPEGMFTLDKQQVTVPPKGTATATLTADTRVDAADRLYNVTIEATAGQTTVRTPASVVKEVESYDLTVRHIGLDGKPTAQAYGQVLGSDSDTVQSLPAKSTSTIRLPKGSYTVYSTLPTSTGQHTRMHKVLRPGVELTGNVEVTIDYRQAEPVVVNPADPAPEPAMSGIGFELKWAGETGYSSATVGKDFSNLRTAHVGPDDPNLTSVVATQGSGEKGRYNLAWFEHGRYPTGFRRDVRPEEMAAVDIELEAPRSGRTALLGAWASQGDSVMSWSTMSKAPLPGTTKAHFNTSGEVRWSPYLLQVNPANGIVDVALEAPPHRFKAGKPNHVRLNNAPFAPAFPESRTGWAVRTGNAIYVTMPLFSDGSGNAGQSGTAKGSTALYRGEELIAETPAAGAIRAVVPTEPGRYRLTTKANRKADLSPHVSGTWTFESAPSEGTQQLPLLAVRFAPELDDTNSAPAGTHQDVPVFLQDVFGKPIPYAELSVEVSYDEGKTWVSAPVAGDKIGLDYPADARSVSLRTSASDQQGNTVEHTVLRAYKLKP